MVLRSLRASLLPLLLITALLSSAPAAATDLWTPIGPEGGEVRALVVAPSDPDVLYTGTFGGGIYKSVDGAITWTVVNSGLTNLKIMALAVHPDDVSIVYAATLGGGVFKTTDGGASWTRLPLSRPFPFSLAIDPGSPSTVYVGTAGGGVFKSTDGGASWLPVNRGLSQAVVRTIVVHPRDSSIVYLGVEGGPRLGVFKSTNGGATWRAVNKGLPTGAQVFSVALDPTDPDTVYAAPLGHGTYRTTNGGRSWTRTNMETGFPLAVGPSGVLWVGASRKSLDRGKTPIRTRWTDRFSSQALAVHPTDPDIVYAGHIFAGVSKTADGGAHWSPRNQGLRASTIVALAVAPDRPTHLYATAEGQGFFRSWNSGTTWWRRRDPALEITEIEPDPLHPGTLYGVLNGYDLEKSTDRGTTWEHLHPADPECFQIEDLAVDPIDSGNLYVVGTARSGRCPELCTAYRSMNAGSSWTCMSGASGSSLLAIDPSHPSTLYAFQQQLIKSTDQGNQWTPVGQGLPEPVLSLAIDPQTTTTLYAGAKDGVYKSVDGGLTWARSSTGLPAGHITSLVIHPADPDVIYAGLADTTRDTPTPGLSPSDFGVYRSTDGGATWSRFGEGLPAALFNGLLVIDPAPPYTLYAGTNDGGIYKLVP